MNKQSHGKKILSLFLVLTLVFGLTGMIQIPVKAAADETKVLAEELEGYNRILPKDFESFSNERLGTQFQLQRGSKTNYVGNYNGKNYLDADVNFNGAIGSANCFRYWGTPGVENEIYKGAFVVWLNAVGEQYTLHFNYQDVDTNLLLGDISVLASDYGITGPGDDINLKILTDVRQSATDESKETVAYQVWVNDKFLHEGTFEETARARMGICAQLANDSNTLTIKTPSEKQEVKPEAPVTPADPFEGYERITLADYTTTGVIKTSWENGDGVTYQGTANLNKSYLDIDLNFNGNIHWSNSMFRFYGTGKWAGSYHLSWAGDASRLYITRFEVIDGATQNVVIGEILNYKDFGISGPNDWFNVKLKFDVTPHATDSAKQVVKLQLWLNNKLAWEKTLEEASTGGAARNCIYVNATLGTISARVPLTEKDLEGYTPITLNDYDGTKVGQNGMVVTTVTAPATLTTQSASFNKTYLDMDVNLGAEGNQIQFHASSRYNDCFTLSWTDSATLRFFQYHMVDGKTKDDTISSISAADFGISGPSDWFNVKLRTDITGEGTLQQTVKVQLWLNGQLAWVGTIQENRVAATRALIGTVGTVQLRSASPSVEEELEGYTAIGLEYYKEAAKADGYYNVSLVNGGSAFSAITSFDKTYINMDVNFNGLTAGKGGANVRFQAPGTYADRFRDTYALGWNTDGTTLHFFRYNKDQGTEDLAMNIVAAEFGINSANDWINVKLRTDITGEGTTQQTATIQLWLNDRLAWMGTITENRISASRTAIYSSTKDGKSILVRSAIPASVEEAAEGYTSINLDNYNGNNMVGLVSLTSANPLTAKISNFNKVCLDVDVNFKGATSYGSNNVRYQGSGSYTDNFGLGWNDATTLRFYRYKADSSIETLAASIVAEDFGISGPSAWFNVKILTDIIVDPTNANHQTVKVQLWLNDKLAYIGVVEETRAASSRAGINAAGTVLLRNPVEGDLAEELEGYTRVTVEDYDNLGGSRNEEGTIYASARGGKNTTFESLHKTYLDVDVQTKTTYFLHYLMTGTPTSGFWGSDYYRFTMSGTDMIVSQILGGSVKAEVTLPLGAMGYTAGDMFNLKVRTDLVPSGSGQRVLLQIWYNDQFAANLTFAETTVREMQYMGIRGASETANTIIRTPMIGIVREDVAYDLSKGAYLLTGADYFYVNGKKMPSGTALAAPNDYVIERIVDGKIADSKLVSLYYLGDVNLDGSAFEAGDSVYMDSHALEGIVNYGTPMKAAMKAADLNNDGKVTAEDFDLIKQIRSDVGKKDEILSKYYTDSLSYEYLGGKDVMPIGGFYGPTTDATLTDGMFSLIQESGINLITYSPADAASDPNRVQQALVLAEKYGIGMFVSDTRLNVIETDENGNVTRQTVATSADDLAEIMAAYSNYDSFLGINIVDEPKGAKDWNVDTNETEEIADTNYKRYNYYRQLAQALKPYVNITNYVNMHGSQSVDKGTYATYVEEIAKDVNVLSFDAYPYFEKDAYTQLTRLATYLESLDIVRQAALDSGKPFWSFVQAGTDYRDDGSNAATAGYYTEADTLWIVNTSLAFGAKGIQYFPLLQPEHFSYNGDGHDYDRNGIIGANNEVTRYYAMVQKANNQIAAIDHVLMNAQSAGVIVTGQAKTDVSTAALGRNHTFTGMLNRGTTYTEMLNNVSGGDAMVGCFNYQGYEAYYVVNYSRTNSQTITLTLNDNAKYYTIADAVKTAGEGSSIALTVPAGAGVLVVLETLHTHSHGDWVVTTPATLAAVGQKEKTCVCGDKITEEIPKLAAVKEYGVTLRDDLSMNFKIDVDESIKDTAQVVITVGNKTTTQSVKEVVSVNVSAIQMNDIITVQVVNGNDKSEEQSVTVLQYAQDVLANESMSQYHPMVKEMLNYGGCAQTYFGYNTDNLANEGLNPEEVGKEEVPQEDVPVEIEGAVEGISAYGASLVFRNKIAVRYYFKVTGDVANYTFKANGVTYNPVVTTENVYIEVPGINPQDLENTITVTVNDTLSFSYSPMTYIVRMSQKGTENMRPLMKALYNYYLAAEALTAAQ